MSQQQSVGSNLTSVLRSTAPQTPESGSPHGYDAAKKVMGRKRHIAVDTQGLLLGVVVHTASIQDADGAGDLLRRIKPLYCWLRAVFADGGYNRVTAAPWALRCSPASCSASRWSSFTACQHEGLRLKGQGRHPGQVRGALLLRP